MEGIERISDYVGNPVLFATGTRRRIFAAKFGDVHPRYGREEWLRYARRVCRETDAGSSSIMTWRSPSRSR
jgi:hypothetical protein